MKNHCSNCNFTHLHSQTCYRPRVPQNKCRCICKTLTTGIPNLFIELSLLTRVPSGTIGGKFFGCCSPCFSFSKGPFRALQVKFKSITGLCVDLNLNEQKNFQIRVSEKLRDIWLSCTKRLKGGTDSFVACAKNALLNNRLYIFSQSVHILIKLSENLNHIAMVANQKKQQKFF